MAEPRKVTAPFPWFGGKRLVAREVWERLGDVPVYAEPFAGSLAVLLGRPARQWESGRVETVNDIDGYICNTWRAIAAAPDEVAYHADWPVVENDLHARHAWLVEQRDTLVRRLEGDPEYYDARVAGWWLWGVSAWIGGGFCAGDGPWQRVDVSPGDWRLVRLGTAGQGVSRQLVHLGNAGQGVSRRLVHLGDAGQGVSRKLVHLGDWMRALAHRLAMVRVCCGDWSRIMTPAALAGGVGGPRGVLLDPPYGVDDRATCYAHDSRTVAKAVREWCTEHGGNPAYRIALCGYAGEGHESLEEAGWSVHEWTAQGGKSAGNRMRERIWFSPACLTARQPSLFEVRA